MTIGEPKSKQSRIHAQRHGRPRRVIIIGVRKRETCMLVHVYSQVRMQASMLQRHVGYRNLGYRKDHRTGAFL